jgi:hypothetical protein
MIGEAYNRYNTKFQRPLNKAWKDITEKISLEVENEKLKNKPAVIDLTKA